MHRLLDEPEKSRADLWIVNSCTVKSPSQSAMSTTMQQGKQLGKKVLVTGCVPQGDRKAPELQEFSLLGMASLNHFIHCRQSCMGAQACLDPPCRLRAACGVGAGTEPV